MPSGCDARHQRRSSKRHDDEVADIPVNKRALNDVARTLRSRRADPLVEGLPGPSRILVTGGVVTVLAIGMLVFGRSAAPARVAPPATSGSIGASAEPTAAGGVFVHVAGAVRKPGLYELGPDSRVADAIEAAGGALPKAQIDLVNLAQVLADGMKIEVPASGEAQPVTTDPSGAPAGTVLVSINQAALEELETLPGVGPVTAQAIISHREEAGPFASLEELLEVSGIGPATFAEIRPHVTL